MNLSHRDELLVQRHLDGELSPSDAVAFAARLEIEPALRDCHAAASALRSGFCAAREGMLRPRPGFKAAVLSAVRQLPSRLQLEQADLANRTVVFCRRLLLAAVLLGSIAFAFNIGLFGGPAAKTLQADPNAVQHEIDRLERIVRSSDRPAKAVPDAR
jgi:anti-sigma factor RsiW